MLSCLVIGHFAVQWAAKTTGRLILSHLGADCTSSTSVNATEITSNETLLPNSPRDVMVPGYSNLRTMHQNARARCTLDCLSNETQQNEQEQDSGSGLRIGQPSSATVEPAKLMPHEISLDKLSPIPKYSSMIDDAKLEKLRQNSMICLKGLARACPKSQKNKPEHDRGSGLSTDQPSSSSVKPQTLMLCEESPNKLPPALKDSNVRSGSKLRKQDLNAPTHSTGLYSMNTETHTAIHIASPGDDKPVDQTPIVLKNFKVPTTPHQDAGTHCTGFQSNETLQNEQEQDGISDETTLHRDGRFLSVASGPCPLSDRSCENIEIVPNHPDRPTERDRPYSMPIEFVVFIIMYITLLLIITRNILMRIIGEALFVCIYAYLKTAPFFTWAKARIAQYLHIAQTRIADAFPRTTTWLAVAVTRIRAIIVYPFSKIRHGIRCISPRNQEEFLALLHTAKDLPPVQRFFLVLSSYIAIVSRRAFLRFVVAVLNPILRWMTCVYNKALKRYWDRVKATSGTEDELSAP